MRYLLISLKYELHSFANKIKSQIEEFIYLWNLRNRSTERSRRSLSFQKLHTFYNRLRIILASTAFTPFGYTRTGFRSISLISSRETMIFDTFKMIWANEVMSRASVFLKPFKILDPFVS